MQLVHITWNVYILLNSIAEYHLVLTKWFLSLIVQYIICVHFWANLSKYSSCFIISKLTVAWYKEAKSHTCGAQRLQYKHIPPLNKRRYFSAMNYSFHFHVLLFIQCDVQYNNYNSIERKTPNNYKFDLIYFNVKFGCASLCEWFPIILVL